MTDHRRERVQRFVRKQPPTIQVEVEYRPAPGVRDDLVRLLAEMLDSRRQSGRP